MGKRAVGSPDLDGSASNVAALAMYRQRTDFANPEEDRCAGTWQRSTSRDGSRREAG